MIKKITTQIVIISLLLLIVTSNAVAFSEDVNKQELVDNINLVLPEASEIEGLEYHSNWQEVKREENEYGIEAVYEALYDEDLTVKSELPTLYTYIIPYESSYSAQSKLGEFVERSEFDSGQWILISETATSFTYKTGAGPNSDLFIDYSSESNTLHYVTQKDNLLIFVSFYREGGLYERGNVMAYEKYMSDYGTTLEVLKSAASYVKEAVDFYLDDIDDLSGPNDYDYYLSSADYSLELSNLYSIPRNGSIDFDIYIDETSEIGTILDTTGINKASYGAISLGIDENAILDFNLYDPYTETSCDDSSGWHHIYSVEPIDIYEWTNVKIEYGNETGMNIYINNRLQASCKTYKSRSEQPLYLGDYPADIIEESFVGYLKDLHANYSYNNNGQKVDDVMSSYTIFTDVADDYIYAEAIDYLKDEGIISGYSDGSFKPDQEINRAEILKMLLLGFGYEVPDAEAENPFSDIESGSWYEKYVLHAYELGVISGYEDGTFKPAQNINKVEFLKILTNTYGLNLTDYEVALLYGDTDMTAWYASYVQYSKDNNLMDVGEDGYFYPGDSVTRGEVAETIYRMLTL